MNYLLTVKRKFLKESTTSLIIPLWLLTGLFNISWAIAFPKIQNYILGSLLVLFLALILIGEYKKIALSHEDSFDNLYLSDSIGLILGSLILLICTPFILCVFIVLLGASGMDLFYSNQRLTENRSFNKSIE